MSTSLNAMLVKQNSAAQSIDLSEKFGDGHTFSVVSSNGDAVEATIDDNGILTLSYGELGHSDIKIIATDTSGNEVTDSFRVRVAGENAYTIAVIPDTQDYSKGYASPDIFNQMTQWLVDNKDTLNIQFATHVGDVTYNNTTVEWERAEAAMRLLDGKIPYSLTSGNHDIGPNGNASTRAQDYLSQYFTVEEQSQLPGFGGVYDKEPNNYQNNYSTFTAPDGTKWLSLSLEFGPRDDVLRWAGDVIEGHADHRVMITTHSYMAGDGRVNPTSEELTWDNGASGYGVGTDIRGASDGDGIWDQLVSKYPNIAFTFSGHNFIDGAETQINYGAGGQPVMQMFVNYQNGVAREITGNGDEANGTNGGNGAIRLITIDPDNNKVYTETYFTSLDDYLDGYRDKKELDRDGLTGPYRGHQEEFDDVDLSTPDAWGLAKAGDDLFVAATGGDKANVVLDASATIVASGTNATFVWKDAEGQVVATGGKPTVEFGTGTRVLTLEVTDASGRVSRDDIRVTVTGDSTLMSENFNSATLDTAWINPNGATTNFKVVGSINSGESEGALKDFRNAGTNLLVWNEPDASTWSNYVFDVSLSTTDRTGQIGVVFNYQDAQNFYRLTFDVSGNARNLVKMQGGVESVLATSSKGLAMGTEHDLKVVSLNGEIRVFLGGRDVFDGPVVDSAPLGGGTVGVISTSQDTATFDNVMVNKAVLTAHGESQGRGVDTDGDGSAEVSLVAAGSFGPNAISFYRWLLNGEEVGTGKSVVLDLPDGTEGVTLEVTDATGRTSTDFVKVEVARKDALLLKDGFDGGLDGWTMVDEGELGADPNWRVEDGHLVQDADVYSRQLTNGRDSNSTDIWDRGWSPLGDGDYILRKGTYMLYEGEGARDWKDYSVEMTVNGGGNDAVGLMFYYQDPNNYYKLELDNTFGLYQLTRLVDGVETMVARTAGRYTLDADQQLRVDVKDHVIDIYLDGERIFEDRIEDRNHDGGTFGLYNWSADNGVAYDDITVVSLAANLAPATPELSSSTVRENVAVGTVVGTFSATDPEGGALTYTLTDNAGGLFKLDGAKLVTAKAIDYEKVKSGTVTLEVSDGVNTVSESFTIGVQDVDEAPTGLALGKSTVAEDARVGTVVGTLSAKDPEGGAVSYSLSSNPNGIFKIVGNQLQLAKAVDYETLKAHAVTVVAKDAAGNATSKALSIKVTNVDEAPVAVSLSKASVAENAKAGTTIGTLSAKDPEGGAVSYSLSSNPGGLFKLSGSTLQLAKAVDYEKAKSHSVTVLATDVGGKTTSKAFTIGVQDINEAPGALALSKSTVAENTKVGTTIGTLSAQDPEGKALAYTLTDTAGGLFKISGNRLQVAKTIDYEKVQSDTVTVQVSDGTHKVSKSFTIKVSDVVETITGTSKADTLKGGIGADLIKGGSGNDKLHGYGSADQLKGDAGNDTLYGGAGADRLDGGAGTDTASYFGGTKGVTASLAKPSINTNDAKGDSYVSIENLTGTSYSDKLTGNSGNNLITGGSGNDVLKGEGGKDTLYGGKGADDLYGGTNKDVFVFKAISDTTSAGSGRDTIFDFAKGDRIDVSGIDANTRASGNQAFTFIGDEGFHNKAGELRAYQKSGDTFVTADVNGDGKTDFAIHIDTLITLEKGDFLL